LGLDYSLYRGQFNKLTQIMVAVVTLDRFSDRL
jgi:hypothetical protein